MNRTLATYPASSRKNQPEQASSILAFPVTISARQMRIKRGVDLLFCSVALVIAAPLMLLIALLILTEGKGQVIFRQCRHGLDGREFNILKFRSMTVCSTGLAQATRDDRRVTWIGKWLRRTSFDELPQLFNILRGEMSLVGPRPHAIAHTHYYSKRIEGYMTRLKLRPGMTGWAQVNGWRGETDTLSKMRRRVEHDLYYAHHWSVGFDLRILLRTLTTVLRHPNAY